MECTAKMKRDEARNMKREEAAVISKVEGEKEISRKVEEIRFTRWKELELEEIRIRRWKKLEGRWKERKKIERRL